MSKEWTASTKTTGHGSCDFAHFLIARVALQNYGQLYHAVYLQHAV